MKPKNYRLAKYTPLTDGPLPAAQNDDEAIVVAVKQLGLLDAAPGYYALIDHDTSTVVAEFSVKSAMTIERSE